jgi:hypothetical protein
MSVSGAAQPIEGASAEDTQREETTEGDATGGDPARADAAAGGDTPESIAEPSVTDGDVSDATEQRETAGQDAYEPAYEEVSYEYGYDEEREEERRPLSALAVATLVSGLLALVPLALGLGIAALAAIRRSGKRGARLAVIGIYAAWMWLLVGAAVAALAYLTHGFRPHERVQYRPAAAYSLQPGECLNGDPNATSFTTVACGSTHQVEVYGRFDLSSASAYPGVSQLRLEAAQGCQVQLTSYADPKLANIGFSEEYVYPDQPAWAAGERTVICMARFGSGISGSIRKT